MELNILEKKYVIH